MLKRGTQIIYVPDHADGDVDHPDVEVGFVTTYTPGTVMAFCRYWSKYEPDRLRTMANSELTPVRNLVVRNTVPQHEVEEQLKKL